MGLLKTAARAAVASSVHGRVQRRQQQRWAAQDAAPAPPAPPAAAAPPPAPAAAPPPATPDLERQLQLLAQLGELREAGVLDDEEFAAKKAAILAG